MADPKIVKNIHIQQWNGDENYWSTQKPLMEGEIGIVNKTNTKNVANIVVGNGASTTSELLAEGNVFYPGVGAGYILPLASNTLLGGVKISDTYFYTDEGVLKLKILKSILDDNPDNPDEFNKANKRDNDAFISSPATDWKLQGDFYAETLYADEARIKNVIYDQETNVSYLSKYLDIHKEFSEDKGKREFTIQLTPDHYYWKHGEFRPDEVEAGYKYDVNIEGCLYIPEQEITVYTNTTTNYPGENIGLAYNYPVSKDDYYNSVFPVEGSTWAKLELETSKYIGAIDSIQVRGGWGAGGSGGGSTIEISGNDNIQYEQPVFKNNKYYTIVHFLYPRADWGNFEYISISYYACTKSTYTIPESLLGSGSRLPIVVDDDGNYILRISWVDTILTIEATPQLSLYSGYASQNILTLYDDQTVVEVLQDDERAGIKIYNYHKDDKNMPKENRKIAELSINNSGTLKYTPDNSSPNNFSDVLTVNRYLENIDGFVWLNATPAQPIKLTYYNKIPTQYVDLSGIKDLKITCNVNDAGIYYPLSSDPQAININACTSIVANGTEHKVSADGKITLSDSTWTNELQDLLYSAIQKITFDGATFTGSTITLKSKIQKITLDGSEMKVDENGCVELKSKIQSITYDGVKHEESDIVIYTPSIKSLVTVKGTGTDKHSYNTINITEDPATRTYWISHYDTNTVDEPVGTDTNIIGESGSETSFNLVSNLSYDHYGHAEKYSSYTLDFSGLIARIEELETKVAELEEQLKAS